MGLSKMWNAADRDINAQQNIFRMGMRLLQAEGIKII